MPKSDLVLLALDDEQILQLFARALTVVSYHVAIARDRPALDKAFQETSPALVVIGQDFDEVDGLEIAAGLLERFPTLPVLLLLMQDSPEIVKKAIRVGISDCLVAPLRMDETMLVVENSLRRAGRIGDWTRRRVKRTTASLQQRLGEMQKLDTVVEHIDDGIILLDEKSRILLINPAARRAFGLSQDDTLEGKPILEVMPHPDLKTLLSESKDNPKPNYEISFEDGRVLSAQSIPIPQVGLAVTVQDITYLRQIDRLKNEFIQTISHDLRSPLTVILGYTDLLERVGPVTDQQREFITRVQRSVQSISLLINDLIQLGRIEAGFDTQKEGVPLQEIIRYSVRTLRGPVTDKKLNLHLNLPAELPPLHGNPIRLRQMLDNLIGNAIKFTPQGGDITIGVEAQNDQVVLRISDTGPGIPPADQPHIFEKFYRAGNVPQGVGGAGLGLAIVKSIVENHQGRIWVESQPGQGSAFTVVLPLAKQVAAQPA